MESLKGENVMEQDLKFWKELSHEWADTLSTIVICYQDCGEEGRKILTPFLEVMQKTTEAFYRDKK